MAEGEEELKSLLMKESEKPGLRLNIQKAKIMASSPISLRQIDGDKGKVMAYLSSWDPKSLWMVIAATKLKDACFLEEKR